MATWCKQYAIPYNHISKPYPSIFSLFETNDLAKSKIHIQNTFSSSFICHSNLWHTGSLPFFRLMKFWIRILDRLKKKNLNWALTKTKNTRFLKKLSSLAFVRKEIEILEILSWLKSRGYFLAKCHSFSLDHDIHWGCVSLLTVPLMGYRNGKIVNCSFFKTTITSG